MKPEEKECCKCHELKDISKGIEFDFGFVCGDCINGE